jgi:hypothetical protein
MKNDMHDELSQENEDTVNFDDADIDPFSGSEGKEVEGSEADETNAEEDTEDLEDNGIVADDDEINLFQVADVMEAQAQIERYIKEIKGSGNPFSKLEWPDPDTYKEELYKRCERLTHSLINRYRSLGRTDPTEDMWQDSHIAFQMALTKFDPGRGQCTSFTSYFFQHLRKVFAKEVGLSERVVHIYLKDGTYCKTLEFSSFLKQKKELVKQGMTWRVENRLINGDVNDNPKRSGSDDDDEE